MLFSSAKIMSGDNYWSRSGREATIYYMSHNRHSQLKTDYYLNNETTVYSSTFKFTFDEFWYSLGTSIFENSSSVSYSIQTTFQTTFHTIFPFLMAIISQTKEPRLLKRFFIDVIDVARFTVSINFETKPGMKLFKNQVRWKVYPVIFSFLFLDARR